jgi:hypothetical protein
MCRDGCCHHSPPSRLRDLLLAIAIFLAILPFAGAPIYRRLHRQIERTQERWPVHSTAQPPSAETAPTSANTAPPHDTWLPLALGSLATLAFFAFWYRTLLTAQSLHPRTRGYPHYDGGHGGSAL